MSLENIKVTGKLKVDLFRDGELVQEGEWRDNVITSAGKASLASLLTSASAGTSLVSHMSFGTSSTAVNAADTQLGAELTIGSNGYTRAAVTRSNPSSNVIQYVATLSGITTSTTINEAGLMSAVTAGTLFAHQLTGAVTLSSSSDSLQITWQVTFS